MLPRAARLPVDALAHLVRHERIGELPDVLAPEAVWRPRDEAPAGAKAQAARLGWLDTRGRLKVDVVDTLSVLCRASVEYYGWIATQTNTAVLAAATGREGVLAVRNTTEVKLGHTDPDKLAEALVGQIPDLHPGSGTPVSVCVNELRAAQRKPPTSSGLRQVLQVMAQPSSGSGELWVAVRDSLGRRKVVANPLRYADTAWGRFLNLATVSDGGELWMTVAPASPAELIARLWQLEHSVR